MRTDNITVVYKVKGQAEKSLWFDSEKMANEFYKGIASLRVVDYVYIKEAPFAGWKAVEV